MSVRLNGTTDKLTVTLGAAMTIGTGDVSMGIAFTRLSDLDNFSQVVVLADTTSGPSVRLGLEFDEDGTTLTARNSAGFGGMTGYATTADVWYWADVTRSGTTLRLRAFTMNGTKVHDATITHSTDYATLDAIVVGDSGNGTGAFDGEVCNFKVQTGVAWSDAESWAEAQAWLIQKSGGTDRHAFRLAVLDDSTAGLHSCTSTALFTNSGCVVGSSRPSCLEYDPLASDALTGANTPDPLAGFTSFIGDGVTDTGGESRRITADADTAMYSDATGWQTDQWVEGVIQAGSDCGILVRGQSSVAYGYNPGDTGGYVIRMAPSYTQVASRTITPASNDVIRIEAKDGGGGTTDIYVYQNGILISTAVNDSSGPQSGGAGAIGAFNNIAGTGMLSWAGGRFGVPSETLTENSQRPVEFELLRRNPTILRPNARNNFRFRPR